MKVKYKPVVELEKLDNNTNWKEDNTIYEVVGEMFHWDRWYFNLKDVNEKYCSFPFRKEFFDIIKEEL